MSQQLFGLFPLKHGKYLPFAIVVIIGLILAIVVRGQYISYFNSLESSSNIPTIKKVAPTEATPVPIAPVETVVPAPPDSISQLPLKVPFTPQAPLANWDPLHEEACEEASLLMVYYFRTGQKFASPTEADLELKKLVAWEEKNGYKVDLTAKELIDVARGYLKLSTGRIIVDPTIDQLKAELNSGRPVIVPAAGRELKNPYFTSPGPIYHMLVLKGYDTTSFIVNDPGTRRGENYHYGFKPIMDALHDWDSLNILNGQKAVVVFD